MSAAPTGPLEAFCTSGPSPTRVHLRGVGHVGRALLHRIDPDRIAVVAATDTSRTVRDPAGLPAFSLARHKAAGLSLAAFDLGDAPADADVLVDLTPSDADRGPADALLARAWLADGGAVVFASKHAVCADPGLAAHPRVGIDAVLAGTGAALQRHLPRLKGGSVAFAGSGSTTVILAALERGATFAEGFAEALRAGVLEPDPELDLRGIDAAVKLAIVAGILTGRPVDPASIVAEDLRDVDPAEVRARAARGTTTRLVGRAGPGRAPTLRYEELATDSALAVAPGSVAYVYTAHGQHLCLKGGGLGPDGTAAAVLSDVARLGGGR